MVIFNYVFIGCLGCCIHYLKVINDSFEQDDVKSKPGDEANKGHGHGVGLHVVIPLAWFK